jgi:hypothetical protein
MNSLVNREFDLGTMRPLKNNQGEVVDKYLPRKCGATSKLIGSKDHASIQIFVPDLDENGRVIFDKGYKLAICGFIRDKGKSDFEIEKLLRAKGIYPSSD